MEGWIACVKQAWICFRDNGTWLNMITHHLRGFGNMLMIRPNFITLTAKVKFRVW